MTSKPWTATELQQGISRLQRRVDALEEYDPVVSHISDPRKVAMAADISAALLATFGDRPKDGKIYEAAANLYAGYRYKSNDPSELLRGLMLGKERAIGLLQSAIQYLREKLEELGLSDGAHALRAYESLDLHSEIERAAGQLYRDGHYANAVEDSVKALNALVRLRSGRDDLDGTNLMETVFSPKNPVLAFNDLADESGRNEQKGFMQMFSGAVSGLRNPRAHKLIVDDSERALEFIAFVSLLAKLLDGATKT
jgi:uncharacterized protein (TIGR02391 family)